MRNTRLRTLWRSLLFAILFLAGAREMFGQPLPDAAFISTATTAQTVQDPGLVQWKDAEKPPSNWLQPESDTGYWLQLDLRVLPDSGYLLVPGQSSVYAWTGRSNTPDFKLGLTRALHLLPQKGDPDVIPLEMLRNSDHLILRIIPFSQQPYPIEVAHQTSFEYDEMVDEQLSRRIGYYLFIGSGVLTLLFLCGFALFQFASNLRKAYLFYGLYMLCMAFYFGKLLEYYYGVPVFWGYFFNGYGVSEVVALMLSYVMYILFTKHFLSLERLGAGIALFIRFWILLCLSLATIALVLSLLHRTSALFMEIYTVVRFAMPLLVLYYIWRIYRARLPYAKYILYGTGFLLAGGLMALTITFIARPQIGRIFSEPFFFMLCGVLLESFSFALGLGKQTRQTELDKVAAQEQLIVQLQREARLERDIRESQVQTLRAQMNPHFIFNALNSIQHFVVSNQTEMSVRYLARVSQLIRRILQNSTTPNITLDEELQTIDAYVEIEQLRFHPAFTYTREVHPELDTEWIRIPHMVLQPFVENAILHGLVHKKEGGNLSLKIIPYEEEAIQAIITDNGIGREASAQISARNPRKHRSISSDSIMERLKLLMPEAEEPVMIEDLVDSNNEPSGTQVTVIIPLV
jgi:sensor histidine kinase YesM